MIKRTSRWTRRPDPCPEVLHERKALIRRSWADEGLRRELGLFQNQSGRSKEPTGPRAYYTPPELEGVPADEYE